MASVNLLLQDEVIRHQLLLGQYNNNVLRQMMQLLNKVDADIFAELAAQLERLTPSQFTVQRLESMLGTTRAMNIAATNSVGEALASQLRDLVRYEAAYQAQVLAYFMPGSVSVAALNAEQVYGAVMAQPFQGHLLQGALTDVSTRRSLKIQRTIAQGYVENKTTNDIIRSLRGTRALAYADGLMEKPRHEVAAIVRTAVAHTSAFVQNRSIEQNLDVIQSIKWSATLDLRTSSLCRVRDGLLYTPDTHQPINHSVPWLGGPGNSHWNCRSVSVPVLKSYKDMGIDLPEVVIDGERASMDGQLPADTTYNQWLMRQSASRQDEVLGAVRGKLLRKGGLSADRMYNNKGMFLTLEQLRAQDAAVFVRAGL